MLGMNASLTKEDSLGNANQIQANSGLCPKRISLPRKTVWHQLLLRNVSAKLAFILTRSGSRTRDFPLHIRICQGLKAAKSLGGW